MARVLRTPPALETIPHAFRREDHLVAGPRALVRATAVVARRFVPSKSAGGWVHGSPTRRERKAEARRLRIARRYGVRITRLLGPAERRWEIAR
jgi:hypothetical protein